MSQHFDLIVIGAGMAGGAVASRWSLSTGRARRGCWRRG